MNMIKKMLERIPSVIFSFNSPELPTLKSNVQNTHEKLQIPVDEQIDAIVVFNKGIIHNIKGEKDSLNIVVNNQRKLGLVGVGHEKQTLLYFLFLLSYIIPRELRWYPIIQHYIKGKSFDEKVRTKIC